MAKIKQSSRSRESEWWRPQQVDTRTNEILWQFGQTQVVRDSPSNCLFAFLGLAEKGDLESFRAFAGKFGVLNLDRNGLPRPSPDIYDLEGDEIHVESIQMWQTYAQNAVLLLAAANAIEDGQTTIAQRLLPKSVIDAQHIDIGDGSLHSLLTDRWYDRTSMDEQRAALSERLQRLWIEPSNIAPVFEWTGNSPTLEIRASAPRGLIAGDEFPAAYWNLPSAFDILATELTEAILAHHRLTRCDRCSDLMLTPIKPRADRPIHCPNCRVIIHREINRESQRRRLQRQKEG